MPEDEKQGAEENQRPEPNQRRNQRRTRTEPETEPEMAQEMAQEMEPEPEAGPSESPWGSMPKGMDVVKTEQEVEPTEPEPAAEPSPDDAPEPEAAETDVELEAEPEEPESEPEATTADVPEGEKQGAEEPEPETEQEMAQEMAQEPGTRGRPIRVTLGQYAQGDGCRQDRAGSRAKQNQNLQPSHHQMTRPSRRLRRLTWNWRPSQKSRKVSQRPQRQTCPRARNKAQRNQNRN